MPALTPAVRRLVLADAVSSVGTGLVLPITLIYLHRVRDIPLSTVGLLLAVPGVIGLVAVPVAGSLMDRVGARRVLASCMLLLVVAQAALAFASTPLQAAPALVVQGVALGPTFPAFGTLLGGLSSGAAQQRAFAVNFTVLNAGIGVGGLVGSAIIDVHRPETFQAMFLANALLTGLAAMLVLTVPEPPRAETDDESDAGYRQVLGDRNLRSVVLMTLLLALTGYAALDSGLPAFGNVVGDVSPRVIALSISANTLVIVLAQLPVLRLLRRRRRTRAIAAVGVIWALSWLLFGTIALTDSIIMQGAITIVFAALFGFGETFMAPSVTPLINTLAPAQVRGRANALASGTYSIAFVISPAISAGLISAGLGGVWIGALAVGALTVSAVAVRLGNRLRPGQDVAEELPTPDATAITGSPAVSETA